MVQHYEVQEGQMKILILERMNPNLRHQGGGSSMSKALVVGGPQAEHEPLSIVATKLMSPRLCEQGQSERPRELVLTFS